MFRSGPPEPEIKVKLAFYLVRLSNVYTNWLLLFRKGYDDKKHGRYAPLIHGPDYTRATLVRIEKGSARC